MPHQSVEEVREILDNLKAKVQTDPSLKKQLEKDYSTVLVDNGIDQQMVDALQNERGGTRAADCFVTCVCTDCDPISLSIGV